jgi:hypothetical protein
MSGRGDEQRAPIERVVAVGDLNGAAEVLRDILHGTGVMDNTGAWACARTHLIQMGDIFNRGGGARAALALLRSLARQAPRHSGRVTVLLGNHEIMTMLGNEAYCTAEEYLSFATAKQRGAWPGRVARAQRRLYRTRKPGQPILPLTPRLEAWKIDNVPGRAALRRALGPRGAIGRALRALPVATIAAGCVFSHAALTPVWARLGIDGINRAAAHGWDSGPALLDDLPPNQILRAVHGPLWNRRLTLQENARTRAQLERSLAHLGVSRMIVGHTQTSYLPGGQLGRIAVRHDGKLVCIDVGLGRSLPSPRTALVIEGGAGYEWTPLGVRELWSAP